MYDYQEHELNVPSHPRLKHIFAKAVFEHKRNTGYLLFSFLPCHLVLCMLFCFIPIQSTLIPKCQNHQPFHSKYFGSSCSRRGTGGANDINDGTPPAISALQQLVMLLTTHVFSKSTNLL